MKTFSTFVLSLLCLLSVHAADSAKIRTFTFQEFDAAGVPAGWKDDTSWADVDKTFGVDRISEEHQVARITLDAVRRGRMQMVGPQVPLKGGRIYTFRVRLRAAPEMGVEVGIREMRPPFKEWAARKTLQVGPEWRVEQFSFEVSSFVPEDRLIVSFAQPGTVWLDSIQIIEETRKEFEERARSEIREGNLVPNGSFRLGRYGWSTLSVVDRATQYPEHTGKQYSLEPARFFTEVREGRPLGILELDPWRATLFSDMFAVKMGAPLECVARVRRTTGSGPVHFKLFSPAWPKAPATMVEVGTDWKEIRLTGNAPADMQLRAEIFASGGKAGGELEIAEVSLQQRPPAEPDKVAPEFAVTADREMSVYVVGQQPVLQAHAAGLDEASRPVTWEVVDADSRSVRSGEWTVRDGALSETLRDLPVGWYQLRWQSPWATLKQGLLNLAIVPPVERVSAEASPWGIHVEGGDLGVEKMRLLGSRWLRTNNPLWTKWTAVQPEKDKWIFPDQYLEKFSKAGIGVIGNLDRTPLWAARNPQEDRPSSDYMGWKADLPADWAAWEEYVRQMVRRYKDSIQYWEVWNEPDIVFLNPPEGMTNAQAFLQLLEHAAPIIKAENPAAQIVVSPAYVLKKRNAPEGYQEDFTERFIEAGGMKYVDIFAIHHYLQAGERLFDRPERFETKLAEVRQAMTEAGRKPVIWNSEWGIINFTLTSNGVELPSNNGLTGNQAAQEMVVWSVAQLANNIEKLFWYDGQDNFYYHFHGTKSFFDYRQPRPLFLAYSLLTKALDGLAYQSRREEAAGKVLVVTFGTGEEATDVAYTWPGEKASIAVKPGHKAVDYLGRILPPDASGQVSLDKGPVYLLSEARAATVLGLK